jgi:predicted transport protein
MNKLIQTIEVIRQRLPTLRRQSLKEIPTRTIVIDPLLESLGWDVRDPDEVQLEYPTVDSKSVDYAMKLNRRPVLLIEAKALDDTLDDVKAVTQVVGYAANDGIVWCILTSGVKWRVYRSVEKCAAPDKLMFEVSLDPGESEGMTVEQIARQMWRFSCEEMAKGTLDALGEQTFTDGKVRKALHILMTDPPRPLLNLVRKAAGDKTLVPQRIKDSLIRIVGETSKSEVSTGTEMTVPEHKPSATGQKSRLRGTKQARERRRAKKGESPYDEPHHLSGNPQEAIQLYRAIDRLCMSFNPSGVSRCYLAKSINYILAKRCFCSVHILRGGPKVWLQLKYHHIDNPPPFARDVSSIGHWGTGDTELHITNRSEFDTAAELIRRSFESVE